MQRSDVAFALASETTQAIALARALVRDAEIRRHRES